MAELSGQRIRHSVVFRLVHAEGSAPEREFLAAVADLSAIGGVEAFALMREISPKNPYRFALTMEFADRSVYEAYNQHPDHVAFVATRWGSEVAEFLEIDTVALASGDGE